MNKFRHDNTFVVNINGLPYHISKDDNLYQKTLVDFEANPQNYTPDETEIYKFIGGEWVNISSTPEYIAEQKQKENAIIKQDILKQLDQLDAKTIRALREGNATYISQYEAQAQDLREQLNATM